MPVAERALESESPDELVALLTDKVRHEVLARFARAMALKVQALEGIPHARKYVEASPGLEVCAHKLYACASSGPHEQHGDAHEHPA